MDTDKLYDIISEFDTNIQKVSFYEISMGYINDTYLVNEGGTPKFILQRINTSIFKNIPALTHNLNLALQKLKASDYKEIKLETSNQQPYILKDNNCWRLMNYIPDSYAYNHTNDPKIAYEAGRIIGKFHQLLSNEVLENYSEPLKNLNFLPFRIDEFKHVLSISSSSLKDNAKSEIAFAKTHLKSFDTFYKAKLPLRICHNDTKLNNILFDSNNQGLCLIDLDTIMKGYFHYDFGDAVRTVVSESNEDESKLENIKFNLTLFENFILGIKSNGRFLSDSEIAFLSISCALMPFMHGLRALTDYLNGNTYYKVSYPEQNLDRCKSLFQFASLALNKQKDIQDIINKTL